MTRFTVIVRPVIESYASSFVLDYAKAGSAQAGLRLKAAWLR